MIAPPSYLYEVSSARAPEGFHSVKEEPQRKDFQVDFPFENPTGYKKPTVRYLPFKKIERWVPPTWSAKAGYQGTANRSCTPILNSTLIMGI